jgi:hypothetical protein
MKNWLARIFGKRLSDEEADALHRRQFAQHGLLIVCSKLCIGPSRLPVRHAVLEESKNVADSGWIIASGSESEEYANDPTNYVMVPLDRMVETDASLKILYEQPVGTELTRKHSNEPWRWIVDDKVVDQDGRLIAEL